MASGLLNDARMRNRTWLFAALLCACQGAEPTSTNDLGLKLTALDDNRVAGEMVTTSGTIEFVAEETQPGIVEVTFDRGRGAFGSTLDWNTRSADFAWPNDMTITDDDRFVLTALASAMEAEVGKDTQVTDNLFRQASLWGAHPTGEVVLKPIAGDAARGWTTLCSGACSSSAVYRTFYHSGGNTERSAPCGYHPGTTKGYSRRYGKTDPVNPCNARCGAGCYSVGTSAWTQDCGNHDICEYWHTSDCGGELSAASDDFSFAPNCSC